MTDCLFCKIATGVIPCDKIHEDETFVAFRDIAPQAPEHVLVIPRAHTSSLVELDSGDAPMCGALLLLARRISTELGLDEGGYRWVLNCGEDGGQSVPHLHLHILGGRRLGWPPG